MKINFGHKIAIVYSCFVLFIGAFVVMAFQYNFDLDEEDYYQKEIVFEEEIKASSRFSRLGGTLQIEQAEQLILYLPEALKEHSEIEYKLLFKRPSDKNMDWETLIMAEDGVIPLNWDNFLTGAYLLEIDFMIKDEAYHFESEYFLNPKR